MTAQQTFGFLMRWRGWLIASLVIATYFSVLWLKNIQPVWLWTDLLVYLLVASVVGFFVTARRRMHLREPLLRIAQSKSAMVSLVVLSGFVVVGALDSLHFRLPATGERGESVGYVSEVTSVLDTLTGVMRSQMEKTYSSPLSLWQSEKETFELAGGAKQRLYPRLKYGGAHVQPGKVHRDDIVYRATTGAIAGLMVWSLLALLIAAWRARLSEKAVSVVVTDIAAGKGDIPWRAVWLTALALFAITGAVASLAVEYHVFGTDKVGMDVLYKTLKSVRTGLVIGTLTTLVMLPFAVMFGILAGYLRGWVDDVIQYVYTTLSSIPSVLLIAAAVLMLQTYIHTHPDLFPTDAERADRRLLFLCIILGITSWTGLCRLIRGETLKLRESDFLLAARGFGVHPLSIMLKHILPNVMHIVLISVVLDFSGLVLAEAVLSYVGVGVDPTMYSWGNMINAARLEMAREPMVWWSLLSAFIFMFALVLAANLFADVVRDAFDPRLKRR